MIFVDADAYIGIYTKQDGHHNRANILLCGVQNNHEQLVTSWDVIDEVATKLSYHIGKAEAKNFLNDMKTSDTRIEYMKQELVHDVFSLFLKQSSKHVSLTDCTNMVIARNLGITTFFSFDHHYEQNGFTLFR